MPIPLSIEQRRQLELLGKNPDDYEFTPYEEARSPVGEEQPSAEPSSKSTLGVLGRQFGTGVGPAAIGLGTGATVATAVAPYSTFAGPYAPLVVAGSGLLSGLGAGALAGMGQQKLLEKFVPGFAKEVATDPVEFPITSAVGNIAASAPFMKVDPKGLAGAARALINPTRAVTTSAADAGNLLNVGLGAGLGAGQSLLEDYQRGEGVNLGKLGVNIAGNALLNNPRQWTQKFGLSPNVYDVLPKFENSGELLTDKLAAEQSVLAKQQQELDRIEQSKTVGGTRTLLDAIRANTGIPVNESWKKPYIIKSAEESAKAIQELKDKTISETPIATRSFNPAEAIKQNILYPGLSQKTKRGKVTEKFYPLKSAEESAQAIVAPEEEYRAKLSKQNIENDPIMQRAEEEMKKVTPGGDTGYVKKFGEVYPTTKLSQEKVGTINRGGAIKSAAESAEAIQGAYAPENVLKSARSSAEVVESPSAQRDLEFRKAKEEEARQADLEQTVQEDALQNLQKQNKLANIEAQDRIAKLEQEQRAVESERALIKQQQELEIERQKLNVLKQQNTQAISEAPLPTVPSLEPAKTDLRQLQKQMQQNTISTDETRFSKSSDVKGTEVAAKKLEEIEAQQKKKEFDDLIRIREGWAEGSKQLAERRGVDLEFGKVLDPTGNRVAGSAQETRQGSVNPKAKVDVELGRLDTPVHEVGHPFLRDLENGKSKIGRDLVKRGKEVIGGSEEYKSWKAREENKNDPLSDEQEFLVNQVGIDFVRRELNKEGKFKTWFKDMSSYLKTKFGTAKGEDYIRVLSGKLQKDAPYSEGIKPTTPKGGDIRNEEEGQGRKEGMLNETQEEAQTKTEDQVRLSKESDLPSNTESPTRKREFTIPGLQPKIDRLRNVPVSEAPVAAEAATKFSEILRENRGKYVNSVTRPIKDLLNIGIKGGVRSYLEQNNAKANRVLQYLYDIKDSGKSSLQLFPDEKKAVAKIREYLVSIRDEQNSRASLPKAGKDPNYIPFVPDRKVVDIVLNKKEGWQKLEKDFLDYHKKLDLSDEKSREMLNKFKRGFDKKDINLAEHFGPIDESAGMGIPASWREKNLVDMLARYGERVSRRFAFNSAIESSPEAVKAFEALRGNDAMKDVENDIAGIRPKAEIVRGAIGGVIRAGMLGSLTGAKDFTSNMTLGWQHMTPKQTLASVVDAWSKMRDNLARTYELGINRDSINSIELGTEGEGGFGNVISALNRLKDVLSDVQGRTWLEQITRGQSFGQGKFVTIDNLAAFKAGNLSKQGRKFLDDFAPKDWSKRKLTAEEIDQTAARFVESVQGTYDARGLPTVATEGSLSPFLMLARWNIEKTNNFVKYVVNPALQGNYQPLIMQTLGMFIGGAAVNKLVEEITGRKQKTASIKEIQEGEEKLPAVAYKLMGLASASGYAGMLADLGRATMDLTYGKNKPQEYNNLLVDFAAQTTEDTANLVAAINEGEDLNVVVDYVAKMVENNFQLWRISQRFLSQEKQDKIDRANKFRDLRTFNQLQGNDITDLRNAGRQNEFADRDAKEFKRESDLNKALEMVPGILKKIVEDSEGNPEKLRMKLRSLKGNSYQIFPSLESMPQTASEYYEFLVKTQSAEEANKRLYDFLRQSAVNSMKSQSIP